MTAGESHLLLPDQTSRGQIREAWQQYEHRAVNVNLLRRPKRSELILMYRSEPVSGFDADSDEEDEEDEESEASTEVESGDAEDGEEEESENGEEGEEEERGEGAEEEGEEDEELPYDGYHGGEEYLDTLESQDGVVEGYSHEGYIPEDVDTAYEAQDPLWTMCLMSLG